MNRRKFIQVAGGGVVLAASGTGAFLATRTPAQALAPWSQAGSYADPRLNALSYAVLAPNPHNQQPWMVALEGEDALVLTFNPVQSLPHTDPLDRQLTIGLGCFLELMRMAAAAQGYRVEMDLFPEGESAYGLDQRPIARAKFLASSPEIDPLWPYVMDRRSNKEVYDTERPVPAASLTTVTNVARSTRVGGSIAPEDIAFWRDLTAEALRIELDTQRTYKESVDVFRIGKREVNRAPDGIDFSGAMFDILGGIGLFTRDAVLDRNSVAYREGERAVLANATTAMGHLWMVTNGNTRRDQIAAGADWLRVNLACTAAGLGFQPLSQALQEYPEMNGLYRTVHDVLAPDGGTVQMLSRIGYGPAIAPSPRWPIDAKLVTA